MPKQAAKTSQDSADIDVFLAAVTPAERQAEAHRLVQIFSEETGYPSRIWTGGMVGFGRYAYRYASGHAGECLATGFAPRKAELSVYILPGYANAGDLLARLGKHRMGKACLYLRHLNAVDETVLRALIRSGLADLGRRWTITPG